MTEETSKVIERRRMRSSFRKKSSSSKKDTVEDPSDIAITTATSTGIEASLLEKNASKESVDDLPIPRKSKKKKKNKSEGSQKSADHSRDSQKSLGKKPKKNKRIDVVAESIKPSTTKVPSMFASASPRTKKKKSKDPSGHGKKSKSKDKKVDGGTRSRKDPSSSLASSEPIPASASRSERDSSLRDIKLANPIDNSKREAVMSRLNIGSLPTLSTLGDSSIDDDDMPFWKKSTGGTRRNSPIASLEEDDTIITNDDDYVKLGKYQFPQMKTVSPPPLSDQDDDSDEYDSSSEESSSSDEEPEWLKKKKIFEAKGAKAQRVAYEPPPKQPEPPAETKDENQDAIDEKEKSKESLPPWANARKSLKKTNSIRMTAASAPVVKEKETEPENESKKEEQDTSMAGLPSWAQARRANMKKTESTRNTTTAPSKTNSLPKRSEAKAENGDASKTGLPAWAQARRTSLKKSESASAPVKAAEKVEKEVEQDAAKPGLPAWANARKSLKPSGSGMNLAASTPDDSDGKVEEKNKDSSIIETEKKPGWIGKKRTEVKKKSNSVGSSSPSTQTTESETDASDGQPPWAKARNSLKSSGTRSVNSSAPTEKIRNSDNNKKSDEVLAKPNGSSVGGASLWAKKKSGADTTIPANDVDDKSDEKAKEDEPKSVKDRLSMWGKPSQSRPPRVQSERNFSTVPSTANKDDLKLKRPKMGKTLSERSMSSLGSQDSQGTANSLRNRVAAYLENTHSKNDTGKPPVPTKVAMTKSVDKEQKDDSGSMDTNSNGRDKAKTWTSNSSPVPEYAAGKIALKKVQKDDKQSSGMEREGAPKLIRMYSSENLKKVTPPLTNKQKQDETLGSSSHSAPKLRKVGRPNEQKWKEKKSEDKQNEENPMANLKKVSPPDEKKWLSPKVQEEGAGKLYSSQHELLRSVKPPIDEDKSTGSAEDSAAEFAEASMDENQNQEESKGASELPTNELLSEENKGETVEEPISLENANDVEASEDVEGGTAADESIPAKNINIEAESESEPSSEEKEEEEIKESEDVVEDRASPNDDADEQDSPIEAIKDSATDPEETDIAVVQSAEKNDEGVKYPEEEGEKSQDHPSTTLPSNEGGASGEIEVSSEDTDLVPTPLSPDSQVEAIEDSSEIVEEDETLPEKEDESAKANVVDDSLVEPREEEGESPPVASVEDESEGDDAEDETAEKSPKISSSEVEAEAVESEVDEVLKAGVDDLEQQTEVENESSEDSGKNVKQIMEVNESTDDPKNEGEDAEKIDAPSDSSSNDAQAIIGGEKSKLDEDEASENVLLSPSSISNDDVDERLQGELDKSNSELMKLLEESGIFSDESAQAAISLSSFFDDKEPKKDDGGGDGAKSAHSTDSSNNESNKKPMSMKSLSDHLNRSTGKSSSGFLSEASPVDEESSGGWSDDDEATIKSEFTDITYGTLGSAVVIDATAMTSNQEATKKLRQMVAAKAAQSQEDIIPGPPPDLPPTGKPKSAKNLSSPKASRGGDILFTPPRPLEDSDDSDSDEDNTRKAGISTKKNKKKKKSKKSKDDPSSDRDIDVSGLFADKDSPKKDKKKDKKKKKEKKKIPTVEEDIVFDCNENVGTEDGVAAERSKKKKKKKKRKGEAAGNGDDSA